MLFMQILDVVVVMSPTLVDAAKIAVALQVITSRYEFDDPIFTIIVVVEVEQYPLYSIF